MNKFQKGTERVIYTVSRHTQQEKTWIQDANVAPNPNWIKSTLSLNFSRYLFDKYPFEDRVSKKLLAGIALGQFGKPNKQKVEWVLALSTTTREKINTGSAMSTVVAFCRYINCFHNWLTVEKRSFDIGQQHYNYVAYAFALNVRVKQSSITSQYRYDVLLGISSFIDECMMQTEPSKTEASDVFSQLGLAPIKRKVRKYNKQSLHNTEKLAKALFDIYCCLDTNAIFGQLPLTITISGGDEGDKSLQYNPSRAIEFEKLSYQGYHNRLRREKLTERRPLSPTNDIFLDNRTVLINLKRNVFIMMFVIASGTNLTQLLSLEVSDIKTVPHGSDQTLYKFKARAGTEVPVQVHSVFRPIINDFLKWRSSIFKGDLETKWLFPNFLGRNHGFRIAESPAFNSERLKSMILELGVTWITPQTLRRTKINWMARNLSDKEAAEAAGHSLKVLYRNYKEPDHQRALVEVSKFHSQFDSSKLSVLNGSCTGEPIPIKDISDVVTSPNCISPSSCLFCENHRDFESADYVWNLASFRFLKQLEAANGLLDTGAFELEPYDLVINRLTEKLEQFKAKKRNWYELAMRRLEAYDYHPNWTYVIDILSGLE